MLLILARVILVTVKQSFVNLKKQSFCHSWSDCTSYSLVKLLVSNPFVMLMHSNLQSWHLFWTCKCNNLFLCAIVQVLYIAKFIVFYLSHLYLHLCFINRVLHLPLINGNNPRPNTVQHFWAINFHLCCTNLANHYISICFVIVT